MTKAQRKAYKADNRQRREVEAVLARLPKPRSKTSLRKRFEAAHDEWRTAAGSEDACDYPEEYWDDEETCEMCGGDGVIEYLDHPEVWGEDCPSYQNHLLPCPECRRRELAEKRKANSPNTQLSGGGATEQQHETERTPRRPLE